MDRKQFLGTLVALPIGIFLVHCSSDSSPAAANAGGDSSQNPNPPGAAPTDSGGQSVYTSSITGGHDHTFTIDDTSFTAPPDAGVSGDTSTDSSHSHSVSVTSAQLASVETGDSVSVTTGVAGGHTHVFTFVKVA
jgi:hypothetical protein